MGTELVNALKRVNYFNHQFLQVDDFTEEQQYHLRMRHSTNRLHRGGIAWGLDVAAEGSTSVRIQPGLALGIDGREIVLVADHPVDLSGEDENQEIYITISHGGEETTDLSNETGAEGDTRILEKTRISWLKNPPPATEILLAKVVRNPGGIVVDKDDRKELDGGDSGGGGTNGFLPLTGGTLTGDLTVETDVTARFIETKNLSAVSESEAPVVEIKNERFNGVALRVDGNLVVQNGRVITPDSMPAAPLRSSALSEADGSTAGYSTCRCVNGSGRALARGDVVRLKQSARDIRFFGANQRIPLPEVEHAVGQNDTGVFGIAYDDVNSQSAKQQGAGPMEIARGEELLVVTFGPVEICQADASPAPINVGDMLTTSEMSGHARKATNPAIGAILGKALQPLQGGQSSIAVFVNIH